MQSKFNLIIKNLLEKECWGSVAGKGVGSTFTLKIGKKIERIKPLKNKNLSDLVQRYDSEYALYVQFASWRLERNNNIICTSNDDNENDGNIVVGLNQLIGRTVKNIKIYEPAYDLCIEFDEDYKLIIFCCSGNFGNADIECAATNYSIYAPNEIISIEPHSLISIEYK